MANYISAWRTPQDIADLLGSQGSPITLGASYTGPNTSSSYEMQGHKYGMYFVFVTNVGGAARLDIQFETSEDSGAGALTDWCPLQVEEVTAGVATQSDYEIQKAISGIGVIAFSIPVRGFRYWRMKLKADAGVPEIYVRYSASGGPI